MDPPEKVAGSVLGVPSFTGVNRGTNLLPLYWQDKVVEVDVRKPTGSPNETRIKVLLSFPVSSSSRVSSF